MRFEVPVPLGLAIIAAGIFIVWFFYQRKIQRINQMSDIPKLIPATGFEVPVLATFIGLKRLPRQVTHSYNNAFPSLTLFEDRIECRVLMNKAIPLNEIENIDIWDTFGTRNLQIYVRGHENLYSANLFSRKNLARILKYLKNRTVPLSSRAQSFLSQNPV